MLVKETKHYDNNSISVLGSQKLGDAGKEREEIDDEDGDDDDDDDEDDDDDFPALKTQDLGSSKQEEAPGSDSGEVRFWGEVCTIPVDYQLLPEEFFECEDIPPPLVSKEWLRLMNEGVCSDEETDEDPEDDFLPLVELKSKLIKKAKKRKKDKARGVTNSKINDVGEVNKKREKNSSKKQKKKIKVANEHKVIFRKRGRPRKSQAESNIEYLNDYDDSGIKEEEEEFFWNNETECSDLELPTLEGIYSEKNEEESNSVVVSYKEHNYFKSVEDSSPQTKVEDANISANKKKKPGVVKNVKIGNSKLSFPCLDCGKSFSAASTLKNHLKIHNGTLLKCTECNRGFTTKYLLKCHMRIHSGDLFMCHKCGKGFTTAELLKVHSRGHTGDRPFICNVCGKSFPSASNLSQHKQTHDSEKKFLCFYCGSSFNQKRCLDGHMLTHSEKNHICTVCGKLWARKSDLSEHMRVHTGVKPYCCSICPQKFTQASSLKRHQIVHMDIKPIQCLTCSKMFKCQQYYKRHVRKHEKEADYLFK